MLRSPRSPYLKCKRLGDVLAAIQTMECMSGIGRVAPIGLSGYPATRADQIIGSKFLTIIQNFSGVHLTTIIHWF
jgi:hypothetical protein